MSTSKLVLAWAVLVGLTVAFWNGLPYIRALTTSWRSSEIGHNQSPPPAAVPEEPPVMSPISVQIAQVSRMAVGRIVSISGRIADRSNHLHGHVFLRVSDATGAAVRVPIFAGQNIGTAELKAGVPVQITGTVQVYRGEAEVVPRTAADIRVTADTGSLPAATPVTVRARVVSRYLHPKGHLFLAVLPDDSDDVLQVPVFASLQPNPSAFPVNSVIEISGRKDTFRSRLQVIPESTNHISVIQEGDPVDSQLVTVGAITPELRGRFVQVQGIPEAVVSRNGHHVLTLTGTDGVSIKSVLFRAGTSEIEGGQTKLADAATSGMGVRVLAIVEIYKGELQLVIDKVFNEYALPAT